MSTLGDVDRDGRDDVIVATPASPAPRVQLVSPKKQWQTTATELHTPARAMAVRFSSGLTLLVLDDLGRITAFSPQGAPLWNAGMGPATPREIRGFDDAHAGAETFAVAAALDGAVIAIDSSGMVRWGQHFGSVRRMRCYDLDGDGTSEVLVGGDASGDLTVLSAADGATRFHAALGQPVTEIRDGELDGNPSTREIIVGGKKGGVWAFLADGRPLWSSSVGEKVSAFLATDLDGDGKAELLVGDEEGGISSLKGLTGTPRGRARMSTAVAAIAGGSLGDPGTLIVGDAKRLALVEAGGGTRADPLHAARGGHGRLPPHPAGELVSRLPPRARASACPSWTRARRVSPHGVGCSTRASPTWSASERPGDARRRLPRPRPRAPRGARRDPGRARQGRRLNRTGGIPLPPVRRPAPGGHGQL